MPGYLPGVYVIGWTYLVAGSDGDGGHVAHHLSPFGAAGQGRVVAHLVSLCRETRAVMGERTRDLASLFVQGTCAKQT